MWFYTFEFLGVAVKKKRTYRYAYADEMTS